MDLVYSLPSLETHTVKEEILEKLRNYEKNVKKFDAVIQFLHELSSEQRSRSVLRNCMDKVLMNMCDIQSLRDILDRLRSVARTNGLRFKPLLEKASIGTETTCQISGDMFSVEIVLDAKESDSFGPVVIDVVVQQSDNALSDPVLLNMIRKGQFIQLSEQLKKFIAMYPVSCDRQTGTRLFMALQSLERDVMRMDQLYREAYKEADDLYTVMHGSVGYIIPRFPGQWMRLIYFLTPYDMIDADSLQLLEQVPENNGLQAELKLSTSLSTYNLPISPLISSKHPVHGSRKPRFGEISLNNSVPLSATFVLKFNSPVVMLKKIAEDIENHTKIRVFSDSDKLESYISLLQNENECSGVSLGDYVHQYHLNFNSWKAGMVQELPFTHPEHVVLIIKLLRKQAYLNTLIRSCIRPRREFDSKARHVYYDVSLQDNMTSLHVTFLHPCSVSSMACADIYVSAEGYESISFYTGKGDPQFSLDAYASKLLQKCFSLPLTLRNITCQLLGNTPNEIDGKTSTKDVLYSSYPSTHCFKMGQNVFSSRNQPPSTNFDSSVTVSVSPTAEINKDFLIQNSESGKKETQHPMLTKLLKPQDIFPAKPNAAVQTKSHPMLMTLLKVNDASVKASSQQQNIQLPVVGDVPQQHSLDDSTLQNLSYLPHSYKQMPSSSYDIVKPDTSNQQSSYQQVNGLESECHHGNDTIGIQPAGLSSSVAVGMQQICSPMSAEFSSDSDLTSDAMSNRRSFLGKRSSSQTFITQPLKYPGIEAQDSIPVSEMDTTISSGIECDQQEADPFTFDDNRIPSKISMPDNSGMFVLQQKPQKTIPARHSSVEEETLKGLLSSNNSTSHITNRFCGPTTEQNETLQSLLSRPLTNTQRRGSQDSVLNASLDRGMSGALLNTHKTLVRQNAVARGTHPIRGTQSTNLQARVVDEKDKLKKRPVPKEDCVKPVQKRRGRPPSIEKKENTVKRKKMDSDDVESRGKIVLNVQLNKGIAISSTTKTKPAPADGMVTSEKNAICGETSSSTDNVRHENHPWDIQRYLKNQSEMDKKKKEKKLGGSSPLTNAGNKMPSTLPQQVSSGTVKTFSGTKSVTPQKGNLGQVSTQPVQKNAAIRPRKGSIKDVVDKLHAASVPKLPSIGSSIIKIPEKQSNIDGNANVKKKPQHIGSAKTGTAFSSTSPLKVSATKSLPDEQINAKLVTAFKQTSSSRSPNHMQKLTNALNRSNVVKKDPKLNSTSVHNEVTMHSPDHLVIDDGSMSREQLFEESSAADSAVMLTESPFQSKLSPLLPLPAEETQQLSVGFDPSPEVASPCEIDDALMDEAVS
ncbi:uncharacterized protein LOC143463497 isoform X3 [Clavelina lepadiformis]|uniref:uncharacterized protein LOC143463497 isoform X3 n=1 Tax=Clavelina lepadiformis TaxID=159417 RepID=UPI00404154CB